MVRSGYFSPRLGSPSPIVLRDKLNPQRYSAITEDWWLATQLQPGEGLGAVRLTRRC